MLANLVGILLNLLSKMLATRVATMANLYFNISLGSYDEVSEDCMQISSISLSNDSILQIHVMLRAALLMPMGALERQCKKDFARFCMMVDISLNASMNADGDELITETVIYCRALFLRIISFSGISLVFNV